MRATQTLPVVAGTLLAASAMAAAPAWAGPARPARPMARPGAAAAALPAGVDAIEFDNVDAYQNNTGLTIGAATQEQFDAALANPAHANGFTAR